MNVDDFQDTKTPEELRKAFAEIDNKYLAKSRAQLQDENKQSSLILESHNKDSFDLKKTLFVLAGTVLGSSIALATGKVVNLLFVLGEFFLFLSIISALIDLTVHLRAKEWDYAFTSKNSLQGFLILNKTRISKDELKTTEDLINQFENIMNKNQRGVIYKLLKLIKVDKWQDIFSMLFILGIFFIFISIIPEINLNFIPDILKFKLK